MLPPDTTVLVAVSGGRDSMALLHALFALSQESRWHLVVAHVEHGIRADASVEDMRFVQRVAQTMRLPCLVRRVDVPTAARQSGQSLEQCARELRYAALEELRKECGALAIAVGQHMDDRAETLLMRLLAGSGLSGITGMRALRGDGVVRPLIDVRRSAIDEYCAQHGIAYREDATNARREALRNRLRLDIFPLLEQIQPAAAASMCRSAELLEADAQFLEEVSQCAMQEVCRSTAEGVLLELSALLEQPAALRPRIVLLAMAACSPQTRWSHRHVQAVLDLAGAGQSGQQITLPDGFVARRVYGALRIEQELSSEIAQPLPLPLPIPGEVCVMGYTFSARVLPGNLLPAGSTGRMQACFDARALLGQDCILRRRRDGDRIVPFGMEGSRLLSDYLGDRKVDRFARDTLPLLCRGEEILWVVGVGQAQRGRVTSDTETMVVIEARKEET